jgi:RNA recognition motif-containing protein
MCCCHAATAFVEMDEAGADAAIQALDQQEYMGRTLYISQARPREPVDGPEGPRGFRRNRQQRQQNQYRQEGRWNEDGW